MSNHIIARCPKCREGLLPNGLCANADCSPPAMALERLRRFARPARRQRTQKAEAGGQRADELNLRGQDAALPPSDRE